MTNWKELVDWYKWRLCKLVIGVTLVNVICRIMEKLINKKWLQSIRDYQNFITRTILHLKACLVECILDTWM